VRRCPFLRAAPSFRAPRAAPNGALGAGAYFSETDRGRNMNIFLDYIPSCAIVFAIPPHPRGVTRTSRDAGRGAVAVRGAQRRTPGARRPKSRDPDDSSPSSLGIVVAKAERMPHPQGHGQSPQRWLASVRPPGAARSKPLTPRAERRITSADRGELPCALFLSAHGPRAG